MATTVEQPTAAPTRKVAASGIAGAVSIVLVFVLQMVLGIEIPAEVASSTTLILAFASGYIVKEEVQ